MARALPPSASIATQAGGGKLHAPSADRNTGALVDMMRQHAPTTGRALEIASGTGQHVCAFAQALPRVHWHPSDVDPVRCASINAHATDAGLTNIALAQMLDATQAGWAAQQPAFDLIVLVNLLHLITTAEARTVLSEAATALAPKGLLMIYGPFKRNGVLTSAGDAQFDAELRGADPLIGYKDDLDIAHWLDEAGLTQIAPHDMPANNLAFLARKP